MGNSTSNKTDRRGNGRFAPGNKFASAGGRARARSLSPARRSEIARTGFDAMVQKHFGGDEAAANDWFTKKGLWAGDPFQGSFAEAFPDPGPHPAHRRK